jgi:hypothetical protein
MGHGWHAEFKELILSSIDELSRQTPFELLKSKELKSKESI